MLYEGWRLLQQGAFHQLKSEELGLKNSLLSTGVLLLVMHGSAHLKYVSISEKKEIKIDR